MPSAKTLLRTPAVQAVLAAMLAGYLRLTLRTMRWRREGLEQAQAVWGSGEGVVVCFWHGRIPLSPACWPLDVAQEPRALISLSADGAFIARAMAALGFPAIRGSSAKGADTAKAKGGAQAFRETLRWVRGGGGIAITPDGPRGPPERMAEGAPTLARAARCPVLLVGLSARPALRLGSWDAALIPLPFGRGAIVWDGPLRAGSDPALDRVEWEQRLSQATRRADALLGQT